MNAEHFPSSFEEAPPEESVESSREAGGFSRDFMLDSTVASLEKAGGAVEETLESLHWPEDDIFAYSLAVREAFANIMEHGPSKPVSMIIEVHGDDVIVDMKGEGDYVMRTDEQVDPATEERVVLPHGKGQLLIFNGCDHVEAYPGGLRLAKRRSDSKSAAAVPFSPESPL